MPVVQHAPFCPIRTAMANGRTKIQVNDEPKQTGTRRGAAASENWGSDASGDDTDSVALLAPAGELSDLAAGAAGTAHAIGRPRGERRKHSTEPAALRLAEASPIALSKLMLPATPMPLARSSNDVGATIAPAVAAVVAHYEATLAGMSQPQLVAAFEAAFGVSAPSHDAGWLRARLGEAVHRAYAQYPSDVQGPNTKGRRSRRGSQARSNNDGAVGGSSPVRPASKRSLTEAAASSPSRPTILRDAAPLDTAAAREGQPRKKRARRKATPASVAPTPPVPAAPPLDDTTVYHARAVMLGAIDNDQGVVSNVPAPSFATMGNSKAPPTAPVASREMSAAHPPPPPPHGAPAVTANSATRSWRKDKAVPARIAEEAPTITAARPRRASKSPPTKGDHAAAAATATVGATSPKQICTEMLLRAGFGEGAGSEEAAHADPISIRRDEADGTIIFKHERGRPRKYPREEVRYSCTPARLACRLTRLPSRTSSARLFRSSTFYRSIVRISLRWCASCATMRPPCCTPALQRLPLLSWCARCRPTSSQCHPSASASPRPRAPRRVAQLPPPSHGRGSSPRAPLPLPPPPAVPAQSLPAPRRQRQRQRGAASEG